MAWRIKWSNIVEIAIIPNGLWKNGMQKSLMISTLRSRHVQWVSSCPFPFVVFDLEFAPNLVRAAAGVFWPLEVHRYSYSHQVLTVQVMRMERCLRFLANKVNQNLNVWNAERQVTTYFLDLVNHMIAYPIWEQRIVIIRKITTTSTLLSKFYHRSNQLFNCIDPFGMRNLSHTVRKCPAESEYGDAHLRSSPMKSEVWISGIGIRS